jgi:hypothetical protein
MPIKLSCITGGCLALLNGGERCEGDQCQACLFGKPSNVKPNGEHPLVGLLRSELNLLPDDTFSALLQFAVDKITGRARTVAETAAKLGLDVEQVELARFEWRRLEATLGRSDAGDRE